MTGTARMLAALPLAGFRKRVNHQGMNQNTRIARGQATVTTGNTGPPTPTGELPGKGALSPAARSWLLAALAVATIGWAAQQFTPMLLLYQSRLHLSSTEVQATFVPYVIGMIPGLMFGGPFSDRFGRRRVMVPTILASGLATVLLIMGGSGFDWLLAGRLVSGMASGAGFSCGGAWIRELSASSGGSQHGPRRLTVAMGVGFGLGPLVAGVLAQWAPDPTVIAYLPQLALVAIAFVCVLRAPETRPPGSGGGMLRHLRVHEVRNRRFTMVVLPLAPWVYISVVIAVGYLPVLVKSHISGYPIIFSAAVVVANAGAGIFVQPFARRMDASGPTRLRTSALTIVVVGLLTAAAAAALVQPVLVLLASLVLGAGYGCCQVYGLLEVHRLATPEHLAGLTAAYQALTYIGFMASYPLAAIATSVQPGVVLVAVAVLAAATLAWTTYADAATAPARAG